MSTNETNAHSAGDYEPRYLEPDYRTSSASPTPAPVDDAEWSASPVDDAPAPSDHLNTPEPAQAPEAAQPTVERRGPDFGGPGYESAYDAEPADGNVYGGLDPYAQSAAPEAAPAPAVGPTPQPMPTPASSGSAAEPMPTPVVAPTPTPAPVVAPTPNYGYPNYGATPPPNYGYMQPTYGYTPYAYRSPDHPQASTTLVLGIVGIFVGVCAPIAWYMGHQAKKDIERGAPYRWSGGIKTGYTLGIVFTLLQALWWTAIIFAAMS